ncbi:MAG: transporter substrate-binding domain-containing protein [Chthoniobacterales bacterium]|nr:transporter substrate-binding domain-containing protein [Chthoniobacterales bacterium]
MTKHFAAILLLATSAHAAEPLKIGMDLSYPPFETIGPDGKPAGISVELSEGLASSLGRPLQIENIPFAGLIPALKSGKIDAIISSMTATPERAESVAFSDPYLTTGLALLVAKESPATGLGDLDREGRTIVVRQGTTGEVFARANVKNARLLTLEKENGCVLEVIQGKADAFIYDQMSVFQNARRSPDKTRALLAPLKTEAWAIALRKNDPDLLAAANRFLAEFRSGGGFDKLAGKYLAEEKAAFAAENVPFFF